MKMATRSDPEEWVEKVLMGRKTLTRTSVLYPLSGGYLVLDTGN